MPRPPRVLLSQYMYSSFNHYFKGISNNLVTEDLFYEGMGDSKKERRTAYHHLVISDIVKESYTKKIWGSATQRYNEARKVRSALRRNYQ